MVAMVAGFIVGFVTGGGVSLVIVAFAWQVLAAYGIRNIEAACAVAYPFFVFGSALATGLLFMARQERE